MKIEVRGLGFTVKDELREQVERRFHFALSRRSDAITHLTVKLFDENGPKGGVDKGCKAELSLKGHPPIVVEAKEADLLAAVARAADRAARALGRELDRAATFDPLAADIPLEPR